MENDRSAKRDEQSKSLQIYKAKYGYKEELEHGKRIDNTTTSLS